MQPFEFITPTALWCEADASLRIGEACRRLGIRRPLLVTDPGLQACGLVAPIRQCLEQAGLPVTVLDQVSPDPPVAQVESACTQARQYGADGVIGLGGGSALDTAKLVALQCGHPQPLTSLYGVDQAKGKRVPLILIPTTAGTGSEATPIAIVTDGARKAGIVSSQLLPDLAILDPRLTLGLPAAITAATGIDAMVHAIEAYTSRLRKNPLSDLHAREALRLMAPHLPLAVADGSHLNARAAMLLGAHLAGRAFANAPVAAVHALAYPLGGHHHLSHGLANALMLPHVLAFNLSHCRPLYADLAELLLPDGLRDADALPGHCLALNRSLGLPTRLRDVGLSTSDLPRLAQDAMAQQRLLVNNPRPVSEQDALNLYQAAW